MYKMDNWVLIESDLDVHNLELEVGKPLRK